MGRAAFKEKPISASTVRKKIVLFFETFETAALVRRALGSTDEVMTMSDVSTLRQVLRSHHLIDAIVAEYSGVSSTSLTALRLAERARTVPRRILLTPRNTTAGVLESVQEGAATTVVFLPRCNEALRAAIAAPTPGIWRARAA